MSRKVPNREDLVLETCRYVQGIPFIVACAPQCYKERLELIIKSQCGSCTHKHLLLGDICNNLDLSVTYVLIPFYWQELSVKYPDKLQPLAKKMPRAEHLAVEVRINGSAHLLDTTWDPPLANAGFSVNEFNETLKESQIEPAVEPATPRHNFIRRSDPKEILKQRRKMRSSSSQILKNNFYQILNTWVQNIRN